MIGAFHGTVVPFKTLSRSEDNTRHCLVRCKPEKQIRQKPPESVSKILPSSRQASVLLQCLAGCEAFRGQKKIGCSRVPTTVTVDHAKKIRNCATAVVTCTFLQKKWQVPGPCGEPVNPYLNLATMSSTAAAISTARALSLGFPLSANRMTPRATSP